MRRVSQMDFSEAPLMRGEWLKKVAFELTFNFVQFNKSH